MFHKIFIPVPALLFLGFASLGQIRGADSGQVSGRIFDGSGAVVPGAAVAATAAATAARREAIFDGAGHYRPQDARNIAAERADSVFDLRHRLFQTLSYDLPVGAGKAADPENPLARMLLGGWRANMIAVFQTGLPFSPVLANPVSNAGDSRPDRIGSGLLGNPDPAGWFDSSFNSPGAAWASPRLYTFGNSGRNVLRGPGRVNFDVSLEKEHLIGERWRLQFRSEYFNLLNTPQLDQPDPMIGSARAGTISQIAGNPRQIQFALRLVF